MHNLWVLYALLGLLVGSTCIFWHVYLVGCHMLTHLCACVIEHMCVLKLQLSVPVVHLNAPWMLLVYSVKICAGSIFGSKKEQYSSRCRSGRKLQTRLLVNP